MRSVLTIMHLLFFFISFSQDIDSHNFGYDNFYFNLKSIKKDTIIHRWDRSSYRKGEFVREACFEFFPNLNIFKVEIIKNEEIEQLGLLFFVPKEGEVTQVDVFSDELELLRQEKEINYKLIKHGIWIEKEKGEKYYINEYYKGKMVWSEVGMFYTPLTPQ